MSVIITADYFELKDANGNVRIRMGNLGNDPMIYRYYFTQAGEIVGVEELKVNTLPESINQIAEKYEGCHCWALLGNTTWYSIPAAGFAFSRMEPHYMSTDVPEIVRLAEGFIVEGD